MTYVIYQSTLMSWLMKSSSTAIKTASTISWFQCCFVTAYELHAQCVYFVLTAKLDLFAVLHTSCPHGGLRLRTWPTLRLGQHERTTHAANKFETTSEIALEFGRTAFETFALQMVGSRKSVANYISRMRMCSNCCKLPGYLFWWAHIATARAVSQYL
jgi:hypothetical protein